MNRWIVVATIHTPQPAIHAISKLCLESEWRCIVVADLKTPKDWHAEGIDFLSVESQKKRYPELSELLPYNHYCRKNLGYLYAIEEGAECILETDDDNIPGEGFGAKTENSVTGQLVGDASWVNVYRYFSDHLIWPRGNPLNTIHEADQCLETGAFDSPVQQYLVDGDPDVDAIYRLLYKEPLYFNKSKSVILDKGSWCAFNSQNTYTHRSFFPALYLPCHVSFRMTDIWRSFVAQVLLWSEKKHLSFHNATVEQVRNEHDLMKDFKDEVVGYLGNARMAECLEAEMNTWDTSIPLAEKARRAWGCLLREGYLVEKEISILEAWQKTLEQVS